MVKHVYLSRRSAVLAKTCLKMDLNTRKERKRNQRRDKSCRIRKDMIITEYIQIKYKDTYKDAVEFYKSLHEKYPTKYDLRKTVEFKLFKNNSMREEKKAGPPNNDEQTVQSETHHFPPPPVPTRLQARNQTYEDTLQLKIPLLPSKPKTPTHTATILIPSPPEIYEEQVPTLQTITEEVVQEEDITQATLFDELDPELVQKIIDDLRDEPYLKDIFTNIELDMGIDLDITEDYTLEKELELM